MGWFGALFESGKNKKEAAVENKSAAPSSVSPEKRMNAIQEVARTGQQDVSVRRAKAQEIVSSLQKRGINSNRLETIASQAREFEHFFSQSGTLIDKTQTSPKPREFVDESEHARIMTWQHDGSVSPEKTAAPTKKPVSIDRNPPKPRMVDDGSEHARIMTWQHDGSLSQEIPKPNWEHSGNMPVINGPETVRTSKIEGLVAAHDDEVGDNVISLDQKRAEKREVDSEDPVKLREIAKEKMREIIDKEMTLRQLLKKGDTSLSKKLQEEIGELRAVNSELFKKIVFLERAQNNEKNSLDKAA